MIESYVTVAGELRHEIEKVKGSRFIATVAPAESARSAEALVERVRGELADARHHCWARRNGPTGDDYRFSDDGEPGGSAGRPILQQIEGLALTNVVCVVTRYFGGTKLGVGGLVRAYGGAAREGLGRATVQRVEITETIALDYPYACSGAVEVLLGSLGLTPVTADYGAEVRLLLQVPVGRADEFERRFRDATAGRGSAARDSKRG